MELIVAQEEARASQARCSDVRVSDTVPSESRKRPAWDGIVAAEPWTLSSLLATAWCQTPSRKCDERSAGSDFDQAVLGQGFDSVAVELPQRTLGLCNESQRLRAALAEGALETRLLA